MTNFTINRVPKGTLLPPNDSYDRYCAKRGKLSVADVLQRKGIDVSTIQGTSPDVSAMQSQIDTHGQLIASLKDDIEELKLVINTLSTIEDLGNLPEPLAVLDMDDSPLGVDDTSGVNGSSR